MSCRNSRRYRRHAIHRAFVRDRNRAIDKRCSVAVDIEEQKLTEEALCESVFHARQIVDSIPGLVTIFAPNGEVEQVNQQVLDYFGWMYCTPRLTVLRPSSLGIAPSFSRSF